MTLRWFTPWGIGTPRDALIVDDSQESRSILSRILSSYHTSAVCDGTGALKLLESQPAPDLALLDVMLPDVGGFEICHRMKADERLREIPVVFITGLGEVEHEARRLSLGRWITSRSRSVRPSSELESGRTSPSSRHGRNSRGGTWS